ncbi:hypothetical protein F0L74_10400 [Chitinophaga agrisoli]|uniref:YdhG-like domain-containing protein n=1 Tax=Chitinophaga agrisoli TaxID=2607653 RepID=A0A5B2VXF3_9BACT|nr:DUF1801 domain-containing protein [Chitinophaga agrisoli]KAA2242927.1 hypothetical protein F0L74_10400 [Chitinophaga agrisoli]
MEHTDKRVDAYITKAAPFAQPILEHIRELVHKACPEATENIKWGMPFFEYKGVICGMAAFKQHCSINFWKGALLSDPHHLLEQGERTAMGQMGRITSLQDLPADRILLSYFKEAALLNEQDIKLAPKPAAKEKQDIPTPDDLQKALNKNKAAGKVFKEASYSFRKEYIMWITEAKTEATRTKRLETAVEWIAEGKGRNWKYEKK